MVNRSSPRCVLLFARPADEEARAKRIGGARRLFALARARVVAAVAALPGVDLVVVGRGPGALPQRGDSFGERLANAFADARALGYRDIVAVPTDVPGLGSRQLAAAFGHLASTPVVLGPSPDGGVYLIGCRDDPGALFRGVRWRTPAVLADLAARAGAAARLDPLADVDRRSDLRCLGDLRDRELAALVADLLRAPAFGRPESIETARLRLADTRISPRGPPPALSR